MSRAASPRILVILGETGSGKSALAVELAERLGGEIVGCDAVQVYRGLDAATAKPTAAQRLRVPHHLVDCVDPDRGFSLADYVDDAERAIRGILARGRVPLVVGGTGMYLRGLLRGVIEAPAKDGALRGRLRARAERHGKLRLHRLLGRFDPQSARRIAPADQQRVLRALELALGEGPSWSERLESATWAGGKERYPNVKIGIRVVPELLAARLDARVVAFFEGGLVEEVRGLLERGLSREANAFKAIGYREVVRALSDEQDPQSVVEAVQRSTRRYAKRQRSWFRREPDVVWIDETPDGTPPLDAALRCWRS